MNSNKFGHMRSIGGLCLCLLLASCSLPRVTPTKYFINNPAVNVQLTTATVSFKRARMLSIKIGVPSSSLFSRPEMELARVKTMARIQPVLDSVENSLPSSLTSALAAKGVLLGTDNFISISSVEASAPSGETAKVAVEITVQSSDATKPPWIATIIDGSDSYGLDTNAAVFTERLLFELSKAGFLPG